MDGATDLARLDAIATAKAISAGELSPLEAVDAAISRAEAAQPKLNFLVTADFERARERAKRVDLRGAFAGVPFLVKDLNAYQGLPTRKGSRLHLEDPPASTQSAYVDAFDAAGLVTLGKSSTPEYGFMPVTEPAAFGPTRNPWDLDHTPGGSSGGAAAAVAAGAVPFAHATDGGGSIRIPANCCGLFGLKPSRGRTLLIDGQPRPIALSSSHCVSRSVRDSATLLALTERTGSDAVLPTLGKVTGPSARRLTIGWIARGPFGIDPALSVTSSIEAMAEHLRALGHEVREVAWPEGLVQVGRDFGLIWAEGAALLVEQAREKLGRAPDLRDLEPYTLGAEQRVRRLTAEIRDEALRRLFAFAEAYAAWFGELDLMLAPVTLTPPPKIGWLDPGLAFETTVERLGQYSVCTSLVNVAGAPAMSVPARPSLEGLPIGAQFLAQVGGERTLLELAYEIEATQPWPLLAPGW